MKKKICVVTGSRAEYDQLYWLLKEIEEESSLELQLVVTGMHLSSEHGFTVTRIEEDGFTITSKIEALPQDTSASSITKSVGVGLIKFADLFESLSADVVVLLGDRYEIFSAALAALFSKIPIIHLHGGESTEGAFDEALRHSISKMAHFHFTANNVYRRRVIQMGEDPKRVYNVGALGLENIRRLKLLDKKEIDHSNLSDKEVMMYIFKPDFSTAEKLTELSGRGVGMSAIDQAIKNLGGRLDLESTPGKGSKFIFDLPI